MRVTKGIRSTGCQLGRSALSSHLWDAVLLTHDRHHLVLLGTNRCMGSRQAATSSAQCHLPGPGTSSSRRPGLEVCRMLAGVRWAA